MTTFTRLLLPVALTLGLAACGSSTPLRYHALASSQALAQQGAAALLVEVLPIAIPERVNREEMVLTAPGGQLDVRTNDRWAAPLGDEMRQMVDDALWRRLRAADTYAAQVPAAQAGGLPQYRLALRLERLDAVSGRHAVAEASWTLRKLPNGTAPAICRFGASENLAEGSPDAAASALSRAAAQVAQAVAVSLERLSRGEGDACAGG